MPGLQLPCAAPNAGLVPRAQPVTDDKAVAALVQTQYFQRLTLGSSPNRTTTPYSTATIRLPFHLTCSSGTTLCQILLTTAPPYSGTASSQRRSTFCSAQSSGASRGQHTTRLVQMSRHALAPTASSNLASLHVATTQTLSLQQVAKRGGGRQGAEVGRHGGRGGGAGLQRVSGERLSVSDLVCADMLLETSAERCCAELWQLGYTLANVV